MQALRQPPHPASIKIFALGVITLSVVAAALVTTTSVATPASTVGDRLDAPVLMARPNAGQTYLGRNMSWGTNAANASPLCHPTLPICVHWTDSGEHAVPAADDDHNGYPDQVDKTLAAVAASWHVIVGKLGFRRPLSDVRSNINGGDGRLDVYLADTGKADLSGYTSSDDPRLSGSSKYRYRDVSAFVVLDNDYRAGQFSDGTAYANLRAAAAHEFFHAVEMAYDYREDPWLTEGTAAWVEDQVFDGVNLNVEYLQHSSASAPLTPLDFGRQGHEYGAWLFFRYLSERFGPKIVVRIWRLADDSPHQVSSKELHTYSMAAVKKAISREGRDFRRVFADFMRVNLRPARYYDEAGTLPYPSAYSANLALNKKGEDTGWMGTALDHLSAIYVTFVPADTAPRGRRLQIRVDGPPRGSGTEARVVVRYQSGRLDPHVVRLNKMGNGDIRVNFAKSKVAGVDVALINASTRYKGCFKSHTTLSCRGQSQDDNRRYSVRARVL
ncbi:MAG: MXAN_6640 family putative metalloprotease [Actinomycetes bacterium]